MNTLLPYILYLYLLISNSGVVNNGKVEKSGFLEEEFQTEITTTEQRTEQTTTTTESTTKRNLKIRTIGEKEIKYILTKMLLVSTNKNNCHCNCSKNTPLRTTEKPMTMEKRKNHELEIKIRNKPEKYSGVNDTLSKTCPYFVPNEGFQMDNMADVFWPKFYNMKETLTCFRITVIRLSEAQRNRYAIMYGSFGGKMDWARCHFEIKPPDYITGMRHFLVGDENERGVMRNFLVVTDENGEFLLQEEDPDQWLMLRNLVLLRDCVTGEVVVFTRSPQMTKTGDIVLALQDLGEEMIGKMLCDEDEEWVDEIM